MKKRLIKHGVAAAVCAAAAVCYCAAREFSAMPLLDKYRTLCDAFTVPGLLALCVGVLLWASNDGLFCGLGYCLDVACKALIPGGRKKIEKYYDYVQHRKGKAVTGYGFLFFWGGVCMAAAALFMALFYRLY